MFPSAKKRHISVLRQLTAFVFACSAGLFALSAQSAELQNPDQKVVDGVLISTKEPALAIDVDDAFDFIGRHPIRIEDIAAGERFIFADMSESSVSRLFIVQIEGFLPGIDNEYRYDLSSSPMVAGYPFRSNGYAFNMAASIAANPGKESDSTKKFLDEQELESPEEYVMWRSLTVVDKARRKEIILFYMEDAAETGFTIAEMFAGDSPIPQWTDIQKEMEVRGNASYRLATLDDDGEPVEASWVSVPNTVMVNF